MRAKGDSLLKVDSWTLIGGTALVGRALQPVPNAAVVMREGTITAVGERDRIDIPSETATIDAGGSTLLPGFIDAHVHIGFFEPSRELVGGVTSVRDLGWPPADIFPLAKRSQASSFDGPAIYAAGAMLTAPGGYPTKATWAPEGTGLEVPGPSAAQHAVGSMVSEGATIIKIALNPPAGPTFDTATLGAIVEAAHASGLRVTGHVHGLQELEKAIRCGVDELAHLPLGTDPIPTVTLERMIAEGMTVVPTLAIRSGKELDVALENLRNFTQNRGRVVYGTDLGNAGTAPGIDERELFLMAAAGMSPPEILQSATVGAGEWLNLDSAGILEVGRDADIITVGGDPLDHLGALSDVEMVFRRGRRVR
jgi:imidazolonepropionase-like amidohydrolase